MKTFGWKTLLISGLFVAMGAVSAHAGPPLCNGEPNGIIDGDEQCETGPCCTAKCELAGAATVCRASTDGTCDPAEVCGEQTPAPEAACPADVLADDGTECDDDLFCTADDVCTAGVCTGASHACDDDQACTADTCDEKRNKCAHEAAANGTSCDDGSACTADDVCTAGTCGGTPTVCDDDNLCTNDSCDEASGGCVFTNNTIPCDDGQFCTAGDRCGGGTCIVGTAPSCDDADPCTVDSCDEETDSCAYGNADDGTACDDGKFCTLGDVCTAGVCAGPTPNACDDENQCTKDSCNEGIDSCNSTPKNNGDPCEDGSYCTVGDSCQMGNCTGDARDCADENVCTTDTCNEAADVCDHQDNTAPCDDGQFCTINDTCSGGTCSVTTPNCNDSNVCTSDSCDEEADSCSNVNNTDPCDDGLFCTDGDTCADGACAAGPARDCADTNACTDDSCNEGTDACDNVNNTLPCDDSLFCTENDTCADGACTGTALDCADTNACTTDSCNEATDVCDNLNNSDPCDDGLFCTTNDTCSGGTCSATTATCDDGTVCTTDSCDEEADSCSNVNNTDPCEDGLFCTDGDTCVDGACVAGAARDCADTNLCTTDACNEETNVCDNLNNSNPCDDGLFCTENDACTGGACTGAARDCADTNQCTSDSCDEAGDTCLNENNTLPCDDGDPCTTDDVCDGGVCEGTEDPLCVGTTTTTEEPCPVCGNYDDDDCVLLATDALGVLQAAVGLHECPLQVCDFNGSGETTAIDALLVLRAAVGLPATPNCPVDGNSTTTTLL